MALPTPNYPGALWDGNEQSTANDPGVEDPTLAEGRDHNEMAAEVVAIADDLRNAFDEVGEASMQAAIAYLLTRVDDLLTHASQHKHGGSDEVAQSSPGVNAIPKAGALGTLSSGWLQQATESAKGAAEIATLVETLAGLDDSRIVTPLKLAGWHAQTDPFGQDYQRAASLARSTTTSLTFLTKTSLTTPALTGTYRVSWEAIVDQAATNQFVEAQLYNNTDATVEHGPAIFRPTNSAERSPVRGHSIVTFTGAAKTFEIQYRATGSTAGIAQARIEIWKVSA